MSDAASQTRPEHVAEQYGSTDRLGVRRSVWGAGPSGVLPQAVLVDEVTAAAPTRVLEVGCGTGALAKAVVEALPEVDYLATDQSAAMVEAAARLGVDAVRAEAGDLPFDDDSFDVVIAAWMLYHVPDLDEALSEIRRVLRPGGTLLAATNSDEHMADLLTDAGGERLRTQFSAENGEQALRRHFDHLRRHDVETRATFPDHAAAQAYLRTFSAALADQLSAFEGERHYRGAVTIFVAR